MSTTTATSTSWSATTTDPPSLLINQIGNRRDWIGIRPAGGQGRAATWSARASESSAPMASMLWRRARADGSYASANDPRVLVGLGTSAKPVRVRVIWPDGKTEEWSDVPVNRYTTLKQGSGTAK